MPIRDGAPCPQSKAFPGPRNSSTRWKSPEGAPARRLSHLQSARRRLRPTSLNTDAATTTVKTIEALVAFEGSSPEDLCKILVVAQLCPGELAVFAVRFLYATSSVLGFIWVPEDVFVSITVYVPCVSVCQRSAFSGWELGIGTY